LEGREGDGLQPNEGSQGQRKSGQKLSNTKKQDGGRRVSKGKEGGPHVGKHPRLPRGSLNPTFMGTQTKEGGELNEKKKKT